MIYINSLNSFTLNQPKEITSWIVNVIKNEGYLVGEINYIFCDDNYLLGINQRFLNHNTYTDIISFDYTFGKTISGDIYISTERVEENAASFNVSFYQELYRVMIHGILHYCGYKDKTSNENKAMRTKEDNALALLNL